MKIASLLLSLAVVLSPTLAQADQFEPVRQKIREGLKEKNVASLAVAVAKDGKIIWEEGFGYANLEKKTPATKDTMYSLASISKPITATGLMLLVEQGKIDLDQPINDYLGEAKLKAFLGKAEDATVRRVANHSAGLPLHYQFFFEDEPYRRPPMDVSILRYGTLVRPPGESFEYANFGYGLLDYLTERISGKSYADFMRSEVFLPLGMTHTSIDIAPDLKQFAAERYNKQMKPIPFYDFDHPGASAVYSSVHDLVRFGMFHLGQLPAAEQSLLKEETLGEMQRPTQDMERLAKGGYAVGWMVRPNDYGYKTVGHSGGMAGVRTQLVLVPSEKLVVAVLTNSDNDLRKPIVHEVLSTILPDYREAYAKGKAKREKLKNSSHEKFKPTPELVGKWTGIIHTYEGDRQTTLTIDAEGKPTLKIGDGPEHVVTKVHMEKGFLQGVTDGDLGTADVNRQENRLHLKVKLRGDHLNGRITAIRLPTTKRGNALSHWIDLTKTETGE